jgi:ribosomal protein S12 methylthiotransferase accessory factor YcaO
MASPDVNMSVTLNLHPIIDALGTLAEAMQSVADACLMARDGLDEQAAIAERDSTEIDTSEGTR